MPTRGRIGDVTVLCFKLVELVPLDNFKKLCYSSGWVVPSWDIVCIGWSSGPFQYSRYSIPPPLDGTWCGVRWYMVLYYEWSLGKRGMILILFLNDIVWKEMMKLRSRCFLVTLRGIDVHVWNYWVHYDSWFMNELTNGYLKLCMYICLVLLMLQVQNSKYWGW